MIFFSRVEPRYREPRFYDNNIIIMITRVKTVQTNGGVME